MSYVEHLTEVHKAIFQNCVGNTGVHDNISRKDLKDKVFVYSLTPDEFPNVKIFIAIYERLSAVYMKASLMSGKLHDFKSAKYFSFETKFLVENTRICQYTFANTVEKMVENAALGKNVVASTMCPGDDKITRILFSFSLSENNPLSD